MEPLATVATDLAPGALLARGMARHLRRRDIMCLPEAPLPPGLRADVLALAPDGEIWIVECKSCWADYRADAKWAGYLEWADRFFWAVPPEFPARFLPPESGLIVADAYDAEILRFPDTARLAPARRKALTLRFARLAAARLHKLSDPGGADLSG